MPKPGKAYLFHNFVDVCVVLCLCSVASLILAKRTRAFGRSRTSTLRGKVGGSFLKKDSFQSIFFIIGILGQNTVPINKQGAQLGFGPNVG